MKFRDAVRGALVDFLDWEAVYPIEGLGTEADANRDYDTLADKIMEAIESVALEAAFVASASDDFTAGRTCE